MTPHRGGTLLGVVLGLLGGVLISFGIVWYLNKTPLPFVDKGLKTDHKDNGNGDKPAALPGKPGDKPIGNPKKFEFYDILEGKKPAANGKSPTPAPVPADKPETPAGAGAYLQAGAFQKKADAENLKGRLAMLGFEANVLEIDVPEKGKLYRVRTGPYGGPEEMNRARNQMSQNGVPTTVVRGKE